MTDSVSGNELKVALALRNIKGNPDALRGLVSAVYSGDKATVAKLLASNGAPVPPGTNIEFEHGPVAPKPEDTCFEVTKTVRVEKDGTIVETWRVRMYAC